LKTISPQTSPSAAHERPRNVRPSSRAKRAGDLEGILDLDCQLPIERIPASQKSAISY
jgi:hypothetical protein